jgi:enoyl-CoA hydratase/carnithine racemase
LSNGRLSLNVATDDLRVGRNDGVVTLTIDRRDEDNRLTPDALAKLERLAVELRQDEEVQSVVIIGAGSEYFSTGILNPVLRAAYNKDEIISLVRLANCAFDAVEALPQVVIAAMNGPARAGAAELALACDIRLAAEQCFNVVSRSSVGRFPRRGWAVPVGVTGRSWAGARADRHGPRD